MSPVEAARRGPHYGRWRAATLILVHVLIGLHIAHWLVAGRSLAPLEFNEVMHTLELGLVTAGFLLMASAVLATAVFGRFFCGWACHLFGAGSFPAPAFETRARAAGALSAPSLLSSKTKQTCHPSGDLAGGVPPLTTGAL